MHNSLGGRRRLSLTASLDVSGQLSLPGVAKQIDTTAALHCNFVTRPSLQSLAYIIIARGLLEPRQAHVREGIRLIPPVTLEAEPVRVDHD